MSIGSMGYKIGYGQSNNNEIRVNESDPPLDTVSCINWSQFSRDPLFITGSWDGMVRIYSYSGNEYTKVKEFYLDHPILAIDFADETIAVVGLASGDLIALELSTGSMIKLGMHQSPICGIFWIKEKGCVLSVGFDNLLRFWALNSPGSLQLEQKLPLKTITCSFDYPYLLLGSIETTITLINLENLPNNPLPITFQDYHRVGLQKFSKLNCCRIRQSGKGILGTVDGKYCTFSFQRGSSNLSITSPNVVKCQKKSQKNTERYGQVNCVDIGVTQKGDQFYLIGGTEQLFVSSLRKVKIRSLSSSQNSITAVRISHNTDWIAYSSGCDWMKGLYQLEMIRRPRQAVSKITNSDLAEFTIK